MKKKEIALILIIIFTSTAFILNKPINNLDEIWNFNFSRNLANGLLPYKDFNIIVPHIIYEIPAIFLNIITTELIIFRVFTILLATITFYLFYLVLKELKINKILSTILALLFLIKNVSSYFYYEYNRFIIVISLIMLLLELKNLNKNKLLKYNFKHDLIIGLLLGITILIKQTTGIGITLGVLGYKLLIVTNKKELINYLKIFTTRLIFTIIPLFIYFLYLIKNNILTEFIDYTILGLTTFSNKVPFSSMYVNIDNIFMKLIAIIIVYIIPITLTYLLLKGIKRKNRTIENDNILIIFAYAVTTYSLFFPLSDNTHYQSASLITYIGIIYITYNLIKNKISIKIKNKNIFFVLIILIYLILPIKQFNQFINSSEKSNLNNLNYLIIDPEYEKHVIKVNEYINEKTKEGYKVYILDYRAPINMIDLNRYNKDYDMFNLGNLGKDSEDGEIKRINDNKEKTLYLVTKSSVFLSSSPGQTPIQVREYIRHNLNKVAEIEIYDVYEKK